VKPALRAPRFFLSISIRVSDLRSVSSLNLVGTKVTDDAGLKDLKDLQQLIDLNFAVRA